MASGTTIHITQRRSANGSNRKVRDTLRSLGLGGIGRTVEREDRPEIQGMIRAVSHLVEVSNGASKSGGSARADG